MSDAAGQHVFVSYVREDSAKVEGLCSILKTVGIPYWRDREGLAPGDAWKAEIRKAIQNGSLVFLACFSDQSRARKKSYMNEELTIAVEEYRMMPPGRTWLIPVRFDDGEIPTWDLGAGSLLGDLQCVDLFGDEYGNSIASLIATIGRELGNGTVAVPDQILQAEIVLEDVTRPESAQPDLTHAQDEYRVKPLQQLTKSLLPDPRHRIQLSDQISSEVRRIMEAFSDPTQFPTTLTGTTDIEHAACIVETADRYWMEVEPFCASLQVAARWGEPAQLEPWISGLRVIAENASKVQGGHTSMIDLAHLPMVAASYTTAIACTASRNWGNLRVLLADATIRDANTRDGRQSLVDVSAPWSPFQHYEFGASIFARVTLTDETVPEAFDYYTTKRGGKYYTPVSEWAHTALRPLFADQLPGEDDFASQFDRAEAFLGVLSQDDQIRRQEAKGPNAFPVRSRWFGRSTWRRQNGYGNPVAELSAELESSGAEWPPLRAGLFGGDPARARTAIDGYSQAFDEVSGRRW